MSAHGLVGIVSLYHLGGIVNYEVELFTSFFFGKNRFNNVYYLIMKSLFIL